MHLFSLNHYHPQKKYYQTRNPKNLSVRVNISSKEHNDSFQEMMENVRIVNKPRNNLDYYKSYLKNILDCDYDIEDIDKIIGCLEHERNYVKAKMSFSLMSEKQLVKELMKKNQYFSKNISRPGVIVKLFKTILANSEKEVIIKVYMYDHHCKSVKYSVEESIFNEIVFQRYARKINNALDFISPELYSFGEIHNYLAYEDGPYYKCMFLIMEYIPHIVLKNAMYNEETMKTIYERVDEIDYRMKTNLLHHNDLHSSNILVSNSHSSPYPEICIIDFGEADYGTTKSFGKVK
jgi:hypothetical protein